MWEKIARASWLATTATMTSLHPISFCCRLFQAAAHVCVCARTSACKCVSENMWQREKQAHSTCNSVCEGTSTHLYDNFLFTMSKDSNTDTIHFPFINWCRNVALRRSDSQSPLGLKGDIVCLTGGRRELLVPDGMFGEPCIYNNVYLMLGFCEHLEASAWDSGQGLPVPTTHLPYLRLNNCSWSSPSNSGEVSL